MNAARKPRQIDTSSPAWLVTYADMATLLLAFFIFLFSMAAVPEARFKAAMGSLQSNLGLRPRRGSVVQPRRPAAGTRQRRRVEKRLGSPGETTEFYSASRGERVLLGGRVTFEKGSAEIAGEAKQALRELADRVRGLPNLVEVRGHASRAECEETDFADNLDDMEISLARAAAVLSFLVEDAGLRRSRLRAMGAGSEVPASNVTEAREEESDRRVEIVVVTELDAHEDRAGKSDE